MLNFSQSKKLGQKHCSVLLYRVDVRLDFFAESINIKSNVWQKMALH